MLKGENNQYILEKTKNAPIAQLVEQLTFNQWVTGSNPVRLTTKINNLAEFLKSGKPVEETIEKYFNVIPALERALRRRISFYLNSPVYDKCGRSECPNGIGVGLSTNLRDRGF